MNGQNEPSCYRKKPRNEEEISEAFARERREVNGGHQSLKTLGKKTAELDVMSANQICGSNLDGASLIR